MKQQTKLDEFYKSLKDIAVINSDLDEKRKNLKIIVDAFNNTIQKIKVDENIAKQNKEMSELLDGTIGLIKESANSWVVNFEEMLEKEKFRSDLANYFIIIIFGKVKAGKSSLGNFIAKHKLDNQTVEFFKYDEAGKKQAIKKLEEIDEESFDTNNLECTVEIQGFKLGGMAWIDTPGLGSMVKENGDLAKKYIQSADYVIYPTSSDSPLQQDEKKQLQELFEQNKKVTICITKSDEPVYDSIESDEDFKKYENFIKEYRKSPYKIKEDKKIYELNKNISKEFNKIKNMNQIALTEITEVEYEGVYYPVFTGKTNKPYIDKKSDKKGRKVQENDVRSKINSIIQDKKNSILGEIFSISTLMASKGIENNNIEIFENSNIPKFYELITEVVKEKATKLKEETPYDGLKSFIDNNILGTGSGTQENSIANIKQALDDLDKKIDESIERFQVLRKNANSDLENEIENVVSKYYSTINKSNAKEIFATIDAELNTKISIIIQTNIHEIFADFDTTLKSLVTSFDTNEFEIHDIHKTIHYTTKTRNKKIASGLLGTIATIGAGIALASNPIGWAVAGTMTAGIIGNYIGGKAGEATGSTQTEKIRVGDNKEEVIQKFKIIRLENYEGYAKDLYKQMEDTFFVPLRRTSEDISSDLIKFEKNITKIL